MILVCAWCGAIKLGRHYLRLPGISRLTVSVGIGPLRVRCSHGICNDCMAREMAAYRATP